LSTGGPGRTGASSFDFSHDKIRDVAYAELSPMKQRYWHLRVAEALEVLYAANPDPVSAQLAAHYEQAGEVVRAIRFYRRAAEVAQRVYAHDEAIGHLRHCLGLLNNVPDKARREEQQLQLLQLLSLALVATLGYGAPEVLDILSRAQTLNQQLGKPPDPLILRAQAIANLNFCNFQHSYVCGEQLLQLANQQRDPVLLVEGHYVLGVTLFWIGSFTPSRAHLEQALAHYDPTQSPAHIERYSQDPNVICQCRLAFDLLCLGYPEQATAVQRKGLAQAQASAHPFSLAYALIWDAMLHAALGSVDLARQSAEAVVALSDEHHFGFWASWARVLRGWALAEGGEPELGVAELRQGYGLMRARGALFIRPLVSALLGEQFGKIGQVERGLELLNDALARADNERYWCDAELYRLRGELLAKGVDAQQAEAAYSRAIQIAQAQQAKLFELRAATGLARLWQEQGRNAESRNVLRQVYGWFTEGIGTTPDLKAARALLKA
jgi:tetratricopeptide (TPR) repeat protein